VRCALDPLALRDSGELFSQQNALELDQEPETEPVRLKGLEDGDRCVVLSIVHLFDRVVTCFRSSRSLQSLTRSPEM
jgi:hypothetical protein